MKPERMTRTEISELRSIADDAALFQSIESATGLRFSDRHRVFISDAIRGFTAIEHLRPDGAVKAAKSEALAKISEKLLERLKIFREAKDVESRAAYQAFLMQTGQGVWGGDDGWPSPDRQSPIEASLETFIGRVGHRGKTGAPQKGNRVVLFSNLFIAFESAGGLPTANYCDFTGEIQGKFIEFVWLVLASLPKAIRIGVAGSRQSLASALRNQLRIWRKDPGATGSPFAALARVQLKYLIASPHVVTARRTEKVASAVLHPNRIDAFGRYLPPS